jgi:hypothetical protein
MTYDFERMEKCIERELKYRNHAYLRLIREGKMDKAEVDCECETMAMVLAFIRDHNKRQLFKETP